METGNSKPGSNPEDGDASANADAGAGADTPALADAAAGESITPDLLRTAVDDDRRVRDLLDPGEQPHHALRGSMLDIVRRDGASIGDERNPALTPTGGDGNRTRKMTRGIDLHALFTGRRVITFAPGRDDIDFSVPYDALREVALQTAGSESRLRFEGGEVSYYLCPGASTPEACRAAVDFVTDRLGAHNDAGSPSEPPSATRNPIDVLDRLADLRDRRALTEEEFAAKKHDLLDRI
jgi:hypothetical protein